MSLVDGLEKLKTGAMLAIIGDVLAIAGVIFAVASVGTGINPADIQSIFLVLGVILIPFLIAMILAIIAFILWFQATGKLKEIKDDLGIGRTGMILQLIGLLLMIASVVIVFPVFFASSSQIHSFESEMIWPTIGAMAFGMMALMGLGGLIIVSGAILFGIMLLRLSKVEGVDQGFNTAGILYLIGIGASVLFAAVGSILMFAALVLIYMSANRSLKNLNSSQSLS